MTDVLINTGLTEDQKAAFEAMLEGFKESSEGSGMNGLHETIESKSELLKERHSAYNKANNLGYEWLSKNANSPDYKANVVEGAIKKIKADIAQSIADAEDSINTAEKTKKFLTNFSRASGALGVVITVEEIADAVDKGDTQEVARLVTKAAVVGAASYMAGALAGMVTGTLATAFTAGLVSSLFLAVIPVIAVGVAVYIAADMFDKVTKKDGGKYAHYFSGFDSPSTVMQATFGGDTGAVEFTRDLMAKHAGFSYDGVNELIESGVDFDSIQSAALNFNSPDGKTLGDEKKNVIEGTDFLLDKLYGMGGDDYLKGLKGFDFLDGGDGNDTLEGGADADTLVGGAGNDLLDGGTGNDTYIFEGNFGTDVIKDSDGSGSISIAGFSGSFTSVQGSDIIFRDESNKFEAIKINNGSSTDLLIASLMDETTGNVLIKNWNPGNLGISLTIDTSTPSAGNAATVNGDGGNNAITLDNLRDNNPTLDLSTFTALYADGGSGNDIIMGMLNGSDTLLGGAGDDIISGGFTAALGANASSTFQSGAGSSGVDSIDGGAGNDFIFSAAGGSVAHGGEGNDILVSTGPAYFQFNNLNEVLADESRGITGHRALTRDEIYADALSRMNFGVEKDGLNYTLNNSYFKDFTSSYAEYNSAIENVKFIGKSGSTASSHSNGDVSYGFAGSYTLTYDYSNNGVLTPLSTDNPSPLTMAISTFAPGAGKTLEDFANIKGANLFGDAGDDYLEGGIYADYLSGGADNDVVFAGAGNDIIDGGDGNDTLYGEEGRDIIIGGKGDDILAGGDGNDLLVGGEGSDGFVGGDGDDTLVGGVEDQYFSGGAGNNIYIIEDIVFEEVDVQAVANNQNPNALGYAAFSSQTSTRSSSSAPLLTIESTEGNNTLALVGVSSLDQIALTSQGNDLILRTGNAAIFIHDNSFRKIKSSYCNFMTDYTYYENKVA
jgi:Ca2+-binding RTX toxin-like protein